MLGGGAGAVTAGLATIAGAGGFASGGAGFGVGEGVCAGAVPCCFPMIAFSTSPGLEMCERSIFVLIPSGSMRPERAECLAEP
jgi:hypothetical protein